MAVSKSQVRIIGGSFRGRKLSVVDAIGLRPTPDRIRETLFNWLAADCRGAGVLDCCAGTGVLGLEALSRGAASLVAIESNTVAARALEDAVDRLGGDGARVIRGEALDAITQLHDSFDIVFIDPPYAQPEMRQQLFERLDARQLLAENVRIYFEWPAGEPFELPSDRLLFSRQKSAGQVNYAVAEWV